MTIHVPIPRKLGVYSLFQISRQARSQELDDLATSNSAIVSPDISAPERSTLPAAKD